MPPAQVRARGAQALAEMGGPTLGAAQALRRALADDEEQVRTWAATALGTGSGGDAEASIVALEGALDASLPDHGYRRQIAAQAIARLAPRLEGAAAARITGLLAPYLESRNRYLRGLTAEALRRLRTPRRHRVAAGLADGGALVPDHHARQPVLTACHCPAA